MITAPFNFVPLNEKVFFPPWAEDVSHDVPFKDGESGSIDITITAKSPIFIRDSVNKEQFCNHNGVPYIPGSSVKGMVRNVLEIMSFGKLKIDTKKHTKITSIRDMTNRQTLVGTANGCGFLKKDELNNWIIVDYGKPRTIKYVRNKIIDNGNIQINCDFETAKKKYENNSLYLVVSVKVDTKDLISRDGKKIGTKNIATISNNGEKAYLVLTGGIDNKKNEFVFTSSDKKDNTIKNIDKVVSKFEDVYFNSDSVDGNFWRDNWDENIGIPIFYIKDRNNTITDIGLSQLFKLAYNYTIDDATKQIIETVSKKCSQDDIDRKYHKLDLTETILGAIQEELTDEKSKKVNRGLKGRVQFSHCKCESSPQEYQRITTVLGSPNPSFYPEYIQQNCQDNGKIQNDKYNTLMSNSSKIAGWKRYPLRYGKPSFKKADEGTESATTFTPIGDYSGDTFNEFIFSGKVRFHNLKKEELGALISSLTFHSNQDTFYHNIGMAKSLGFGKIKIDIDTSKYSEALQEFEIMINKWSKEKNQKEWIETEQIKELFTMAFKDLNIDNKLKYLKLDPEEKPSINEFVDKKNNKECLPKVSKLFDINGNLPKSLLTDAILEDRVKKEEEIQEQKKYDEKLKEANNTENVQIIKNCIEFLKEKCTEDENIQILQDKYNNIISSQQANKFAEVNKKIEMAYQLLIKKKGTKSFKRDCEKFIKKWSKSQENKGSSMALEYVEKVKKY